MDVTTSTANKPKPRPRPQVMRLTDAAAARVRELTARTDSEIVGLRVGITNGGWKLVYTDKPNMEIRIGDHARKSVDVSYSLGMMVKEDGSVMDVNPNYPAFKAGLAPGMKIVSINGRGWSTDVLHAAIAASRTSTAPLELVVENGSFTETYKVNYHGGERYPHLERDSTKPNTLDEVIKSRAR